MKKIALFGKHGTGHFALVDDEDYPLVSTFRWYLHSAGYAQACTYAESKKTYRFMHQVVLPVIPPGMVRDHKDRNRLNNQRRNLRVCSPRQNSAWSRQRTTTGLRGVHWAAHANKYRVMLKGLGAHRHVGYFSDKTEAAKAYNKAAYQLYGEFAVLNRLPGTGDPT